MHALVFKGGGIEAKCGEWGQQAYTYGVPILLGWGVFDQHAVSKTVLVLQK
jgi:hypothetical protein